MSRIHSRRRGRAGSQRPYPWTRPEWVTVDADEATEQAVRLAKSGLSSAQVGAQLRDGYAIPSVRLVTGKRLGTLLHDNGIKGDIPEDIEALLKRVVKLQRHLSQNPKDLANRRGLNLMESRIRRLAIYYRQHKVLPETWSYSATRAVLQVE
ncbi:MAG: 30S ribosomal protein S15 [Thermoplasmata archaeon]|nr:30S ribosomal protein S15 [Thermoplasmata archaeon]